MIFNLSIVNLINLIGIAIGIGICSLCFMQITASIHLRKEVRNYFQVFFALIIVYISTHLARQLMEGIQGNGIHIALNIVTFIEIVAAGFMAALMSMLILVVSKPDQFAKGYRAIFIFLAMLHIIIMFVDLFTNVVFYFDEGNIYHRGPGYILSNISSIIMLLIDIFLLIQNRKKIDKMIKIAFWIYMIAPLLAIAVQSFVYGVQLIIFATVGSAVYMFSVIIKNQNDKYEKQQKENSRIETELTMASSIQADMLPNIYPAFPEREEFDIFASMDPAKEVGGDFYDFFLVDDDHLCILIADVSGKGVPAALFMMASMIILANNASLGKSPAQILTDTNTAICSNNREEMFVTVWLGILEISTGKLTAANAGHEYPALMHPDGNFELIKEKHGFVIGAMEEARYKEFEFKLEPGSKLFIYTDGVPEATRHDKEQFGTTRMVDTLNIYKDKAPVDILSGIQDAVDDFVKNEEQFDDLTMLCLEYKGKKEKDNI